MSNNIRKIIEAKGLKIRFIAAVAGIFASAGITKAWSEKYEK